MNKKWILMSFLLSLVIVCSACAQSTNTENTEDKKEVDEAALTIYSEIMDRDQITIDSAYELLTPYEFGDSEEGALVQKLSELIECEGTYSVVSDSTDKKYGAEVSYYLQLGEVYSTVTFSGYIGTIDDGLVTVSDDDEYAYLSNTKGHIGEQEQDFSIHFSKEQLHIQWADICDYVLNRDDDVEIVTYEQEFLSEYTTPFGQTETYEKIVTYMDENFTDFNHSVDYSVEDRAVCIYIEAPENTRSQLMTNSENVLSSWDNIVDALKKMSKPIYTMAHVSGNCEHAYIFMVDKLNDDNKYDKSEYLVCVDQETEKYNVIQYGKYVEEKTAGSSSSDSNSSSTTNNKNTTGSTKVKCSMCNGTGSVKYYYGESDQEAILSGNDPYTYGPCSSCDGTGYITVENKGGSGGQICPSCGKSVSSLVTKSDAAGVSRTWCSSCWSDYNAIMN